MASPASPLEESKANTYSSPASKQSPGGKASGCCSNGVCSAGNKTTPSPVRAPVSPVNNSSCCSNGVCSAPSKTTHVPTRPAANSVNSSSCCSGGVCSAPKKTSPVPSRPAVSNGGCCSDGVCSAPSKTVPPPPRVAANPVGGSSGCCSGGVCTAPKQADDSAELKKALLSLNADDVKDVGNMYYKKAKFVEALQLYDRAIFLSPNKAPYRANRAAALAGIGRIQEAISECQQAIALDLSYTRAHQRLVGLFIRIGKFNEARMSIKFAPAGELKEEANKLEQVEGHMSKAEEAEKALDWSSVLKESDAAINLGADSIPRILKWKAEALVKLRRLDEADFLLRSAFLRLQKIDNDVKYDPEQGKLLVLSAKVDLALGRFENSMGALESALKLDPDNKELVSLLKTGRSLGRARNKGNDLYKAGDFKGAAAAYGEGLVVDPTNAVLLCNRAACYSKLLKWEDSLKDCNAALESHPRYTKGMLRRANCFTKLEKWQDAVHDYEKIQKEVPHDPEIAKLLAEARAGLQKSTGKDDATIPKSSVPEASLVVEVISTEQFREAVNSSGVVVVDFAASWCGPCKQIAPLVAKLSKQYKTAKFLKVDIDKNRALATSENIQSVPTFKIYKNGKKLKEILGANAPELETSVQQYCKALRVEF